MNTKIKKILGILLCVAVLVGLMTTAAFAWTVPTLSGGKTEWNIQLSDEGVLTWDDMGSATYDIYVDETEMGGTVTKIYDIVGNSYHLINRLKELKIENGYYYFYIKAIDTDAVSGDISFRYVSPEPKLPSPQNLRWEGTVAMWDGVDGAAKYEVILYSNSGSRQLTKTTTETQYDWSTNVYNDGFWFEVIAIGDGCRDSNAAEGPKYGNYSWTAPTLSGGKAEWNVRISDTGVLTWNDMGGTSYDIEVDKTAMGGTVTKIYGINTNSYNLINRFRELKFDNGTYYFTIKANGQGTNSGTISFMYISPETKLSAPQNLWWDGTVAKWDGVAGAAEYTVKLYSDSGSLQLTKTTAETEYDWSTNIYNDGFWFEVVATADNCRDSNAAEGPVFLAPTYWIGAYVYDDTLGVEDSGGQVSLTTNKGTDGWSDSGYIKEASQGTTVTLNAKPAAGYKFVEWRQGTEGATVSTNANYVFNAAEQKFLYAIFEKTVNFPPGSGTINNPVSVTSFDELKYALEDPDIQGIVVNSFENSPYQTFYTLEKEKDFKAGNLAITVPVGTEKYLTINADINIRVPYVDYLLYSFIGNYGNLTIGGSGSLNVSMNARGYPSAIMYNNGNLEIGGDVTFDPTNKSFDSVHGYSVINNRGKTVIYSGAFIGYDTSAVSYYNGSLDIYGGTFKVKNGDEQAFGLNTDSHLTTEEHDVNLYGGTFEGIRADQSTGPDIVKLPDLLPYGAYYIYAEDSTKFNPSGKKETHETLTVKMHEIIDEVVLNVTAPKENETPSYNVGSGSIYYGAAKENGVPQSEFVMWYESSNGTDGWTEMATSAKFRAGYYYKVCIDVMTMKGALFELYDNGISLQPNVTATVNGYYASAQKLEMTDPSEYMRVEYNFGQVNDSVIENIIITDVVAPVAGEYPSYTCSLQGSGYHLATYKDKNYDAYWVNEKWPMIKNGMGWWDVTNGDWHYGNKPFAFGHEYQILVYIQTDNGFELYSTGNNYQSLVHATVNGQAASLEKTSMAQYEQTAMYTFECGPKLVTSVEITGLDVPQAGETPDFAAEVDLPEFYQLNPNYGIGGIIWYDDEGNEMEAEDIFGEWDCYRLTIQLIPVEKDGEKVCKFHDTRTTAKINGTAVKKHHSTWDEVSASPKKVTIFYTFTKDASTVKGTITSFKEENVDIAVQLIKSGEADPTYTAVVSGNYTGYSLSGVDAGTYTMTVSKENHVSRDSEVVVDGGGTVVQDVKIHLVGDIDGNGDITSKDKKLLYNHINDPSKQLTGYEYDVADVSGEGELTSKDKKLLYNHLNDPSKSLWS